MIVSFNQKFKTIKFLWNIWFVFNIIFFFIFFRKIIAKYEIEINELLNKGDNSDEIDKASRRKGFDVNFRSFDNQIHISSVSLSEYRTVKNNINKFCNHWNKNANTLLTKIYGLFEIKFESKKYV